MGAFDYVMTKTQADWYMANFTEDQLAYFYGFPAWSVAVWASAVWAAFAASLLLLFRMKGAGMLFVVGTAGFVINTIYLYGFTPALEIMGAGGTVFNGVIFASLVFFLWFSRFSAHKGWLR